MREQGQHSTDLDSDRPTQGPRQSAFIRTLRRVEQSDRLDPAVRTVAPVAARLVANRRLRRLFHGDATGIPLHVIYTDAPFGALFMALFLDLFRDAGTRRAATRLVGFGVVAAVPTAITGWAEWALADRGTRRIGVLHATANAIGALIFLGSWVARLNGRHDVGVRLARLGAMVLIAGGMMGGYMRSDRSAVPDDMPAEQADA
jgi:uncharacterized membrane protein